MDQKGDLMKMKMKNYIQMQKSIPQSVRAQKVDEKMGSLFEFPSLVLELRSLYCQK